ncbi:MAG: CAP domain-containing protein [Bryobacteraceae bacterium]
MCFLLIAKIVSPQPFREPDTGKRLPRIAHEMVAAHNSLRAQYGIPPLRWSGELAAYAQNWANTLIASGKFAHHGNSPYGENLFEISGGSATAYDVVSAWAAEGRNYDYQNNTCSGRCGHYTQVVWRDTKMVGCGMARDRRRELWVCDYEPHGNIVGERPY